MTSKYKLICFDAGFTLIKPRRELVVSVASVMAQEGLALTEDALRRAWNVANRWFWEEYHQPGNAAWGSDDGIHTTWRQYHGLMFRELGIEDEGHRLADTLIASQFSSENWEPYPDVVPALDALHSSTAKLSVISDWNSRLNDVLDELGLLKYFDFLLASGSAGVAKPSAEFYRMALSRAGVEPHDAIMIGDSYRADVLGARAAGMDAVLLARDGADNVEDVLVIRSLAEIVDLISDAGSSPRG